MEKERAKEHVRDSRTNDAIASRRGEIKIFSGFEIAAYGVRGALLAKINYLLSKKFTWSVHSQTALPFLLDTTCH